MEIVTKSEKETFAFAKAIAKELKGGEIIGLIGDLGAGKTALTKGLAKGLGIKNNVTSPTFVLMKVYPVKNNKKVKTLCHIDAYRIKTAGDLLAVGAKDYFDDPESVTVVEWADRIKKILPKKTRLLYIDSIGENKRQIKIKK